VRVLTHRGADGQVLGIWWLVHHQSVLRSAYADESKYPEGARAVLLNFNLTPTSVVKSAQWNYITDVLAGSANPLAVWSWDDVRDTDQLPI